MQKNDLYIVYGDKPAEMAKKIMQAAAVEEMIGDKNSKIGLKPNLVVARPADEGATTHPEILAGVIEYLQAKGFFNISIIEGSWVGDRTASAFKVCGYTDIARRYKVDLIDTQKDSYKSYDCKGIDINICDSAMAVDFMINLPVLKGHCQTAVTCSLKNNKGVIPDKEKRRFHTMGLHKPIAHLNTVAKNDFIIVDGICGDLNFEEGGNPVTMNKMIGAADPVLCDALVCEQMGYSPNEIPYIRMAEELGVGSADLSKANLIEINQAQNEHQSISIGQKSNRSRRSRKVERLARQVIEKDACSACYGSLIRALERLDETGELNRLQHKIAIGQAFKNVSSSDQLGIGSCTSKFDCYVKGCPPKAIDILEFLRSQL